MDIYRKPNPVNGGGKFKRYENNIRHMPWISNNLRKRNFKKLGADVKVINNSKNGLKINMNCGSTNLEPLKALKESPSDIDLVSMGMQIE